MNYFKSKILKKRTFEKLFNEIISKKIRLVKMIIYF